MSMILEKNMTINHQWLRWWHQWWREVVSEIRCRPAAPDAEMPIRRKRLIRSRRKGAGVGEGIVNRGSVGNGVFRAGVGEGVVGRGSVGNGFSGEGGGRRAVAAMVEIGGDWCHAR